MLPDAHTRKVRRHIRLLFSVVFPLAMLSGCRDKGHEPALETGQTEKLIGLPVQDFPPPQGPTGFDELPDNAPDFDFTVTQRPLSGPKPRQSYDSRPLVQARASDGTLYEAFCGYDDPKAIAPGHGFVSTLANRRHHYGGAEYYPHDVFIGKREAGRLKPTLFFRDVGSHNTAPHHLTIDGQGQCHLAVADVDIYQDNRLHLYWLTGDPVTGKWAAAWLIDRRGFTSWSHPWSGAWGGKVHLIWTWYDGRKDSPAPGSGAFHVERTPDGFGRKTRIIQGEVSEWDAAVDPKSGRLLLVFSKEDRVYVMSRPDQGAWTRSVRLDPKITKNESVSVEASEDGAFVIRTGSEATREWLLKPK
jgi:hypothetical protein